MYNLSGLPTLQELVDKSFQIRKSSQTSSWHSRRVEDAVRAYRELACLRLTPLSLLSSLGLIGGTLKHQELKSIRSHIRLVPRFLAQNSAQTRGPRSSLPSC